VVIFVITGVAWLIISVAVLRFNTSVAARSRPGRGHRHRGGPHRRAGEPPPGRRHGQGDRVVAIAADIAVGALHA
jgi:hypothetical protein